MMHHILKPESEWNVVDFGEVIDALRTKAGKADTIENLNKFIHEQLRLKRIRRDRAKGLQKMLQKMLHEPVPLGQSYHRITNTAEEM